MTEPDTNRAQPIGINHIALAVGDVAEAIEFYRSIFAVDLRGRSDSAAFLDMGDQFLALSETDDAGADRDDHRHVGLVVDDVAAVERALDDHGIDRLSTNGLDFQDPWGNRIQIVAYEDVQFTKAEHVLAGMGRSDLDKTDDAIEELTAKGMAPR